MSTEAAVEITFEDFIGVCPQCSGCSRMTRNPYFWRLHRAPNAAVPVRGHVRVSSKWVKTAVRIGAVSEVTTHCLIAHAGSLSPVHTMNDGADRVRKLALADPKAC